MCVDRQPRGTVQHSVLSTLEGSGRDKPAASGHRGMLHASYQWLEMQMALKVLLPPPQTGEHWLRDAVRHRSVWTGGIWDTVSRAESPEPSPRDLSLSPSC